MQQPYTAAAGFEEALPLLLTAVADGRLTMDDITLKLSENPRSIFGLAPQPDTHIEIEPDRVASLSQQAHWSPLAHKLSSGSVHRVVVRGTTSYLDGKPVSSSRKAVDLGDTSTSAPSIPRRKSTRFSMSTIRPHLLQQASNDTLLRSPLSSQFSHITKSPTLGAVSHSENRELLQPSLMSLPGPIKAPLSAFFPSEPAFSRRHVLSAKQYTREDLHALFSIAHEMRIQVERNSAIEVLRGRVLCNLFFEPSTRTSTSFEAAMLRLGGTVSSVPVDRSSVSKGETLSDTIRTVACYSDAIVLRHPDVGSAQVAAKFSPVPIINGGDGTGEHPTQVRKVSKLVKYMEAYASVSRRCLMFILSAKSLVLLMALRSQVSASSRFLTEAATENLLLRSGRRSQKWTYSPQSRSSTLHVLRHVQLHCTPISKHARIGEGRGPACWHFIHRSNRS